MRFVQAKIPFERKLAPACRSLKNFCRRLVIGDIQYKVCGFFAADTMRLTLMFIRDKGLICRFAAVFGSC